MRKATSCDRDLPLNLSIKQVKPIFATPPSHTCKHDDTRTYTITLEEPIKPLAGDYYDITVVQNSTLVAACPKEVWVPQGESTFDLDVTAASTGSGKAYIEIRERSEGGVLSVTLEIVEDEA